MNTYSGNVIKRYPRIGWNDALAKALKGATVLLIIVWPRFGNTYRRYCAAEAKKPDVHITMRMSTGYTVIRYPSGGCVIPVHSKDDESRITGYDIAKTYVCILDGPDIEDFEKGVPNNAES